MNEVAGFPADAAAEELTARRERVLAAVGGESVALLQGAPAPAGFRRFRQTNDFYYLTGVEVPHAYLLVNGRTRASTLYLPQPELQGEQARKRSGAERVAGPERLAADLAALLTRRPGLTVWTPLAPAEGAGATRDTLLAAHARAASDPWDGAPAREARFSAHLRRRFPQVEVRDLSPVLDGMRLIKSPTEVGLMRRAGRLCGLGLIEAMRGTRPGVAEYELEAAARFVFRRGGAEGEGYCAIVPSGPNVWDAHYAENSRTLEEGDLVLMDYAPDYRHYTSDIGRMWPAGGTFVPWQRELYGFMVQYHRCLLRRLRPGATAAAILGEAAAEMRAALEQAPLSRPIYAEAARRALDFAGHLSHPVGMAVHDVGDYRPAPLAPGLVLAIDPQLWVPEERLYIRVEDTVVITADGHENLTGFVPQDPVAVERLVREPGLLQLRERPV